MEGQKKPEDDPTRRGRSITNPRCVVCWGEDSPDAPLVQACGCVKYGLHHYPCLVEWLKTNGDKPCTICKQLFTHPRMQRVLYQPSPFEIIGLLLFTRGEEGQMPVGMSLVWFILAMLLLVALCDMQENVFPVLFMLAVGWLMKDILQGMDRINALYPHRLIHFEEYTHLGVHHDAFTFNATQRNLQLGIGQEPDPAQAEQQQNIMKGMGLQPEQIPGAQPQAPDQQKEEDEDEFYCRIQ